MVEHLQSICRALSPIANSEEKTHKQTRAFLLPVISSWHVLPQENTKIHKEDSHCNLCNLTNTIFLILK